MKRLTICMYGAGSDKIPKKYITETEALGREIAWRGHTVIYGGGASGLMGAVARGAASAGGIVVGVVPDFIRAYEPIDSETAQLIKVETMAERKKVMEKNSDAFIIAPGGIGTFDEFFQVLTLVELDRTSAPIVLYNINHFYDDLIEVVERCIDQGFIRPIVRELYVLKDTPEEVLDYIEEVLGEEE